MILPPLQSHNHPDFPSMRWTDLEMDAIKAYALLARGCIDGLLKRTPVRDVAETLAEIDDAIGEKK